MSDLTVKVDADENISFTPSVGELELRFINTESNVKRFISKDSSYTDEYVETDHGKILVSWKGNRMKQALLTFHDIGLNAIASFQAFFNYPSMVEIAQNFCVFHVNAIGAETEAETLSEDFQYPSMDQMAEQIRAVLDHFSIVRYVGIGVGLGGNVLLRHAFLYPERVDSLMLVNTLSGTAGWIEWAYQKRNIQHMRQHGMSQAVVDYLMWHHFGSDCMSRPRDLVNVINKYLAEQVNAVNLAKLTEQYIWRTNIDLVRDGVASNLTNPKISTTIQVPILNVVGAFSPFVNETVILNGNLNPTKSSWIKIQDSSMPLEEQPGKICEAFLLFMQGQSFCLSIRRLSAVGSSY